MKVLILTGPDSESQRAVSRALRQALSARGDSCLVFDALSLLGQHPTLTQIRALEEALALPRGFAFLSANGSFIRSGKRRTAVYEVNARYAEHLNTLLREGEFDAVLCLHRYPAEAVSHVRKTLAFSARCCYLSCDYACVPFLEETRLDHYFIAHESYIKPYTTRGIPEKKLIPSGIPVPEDWFRQEDRADARTLLNLPQQMPCYYLPYTVDAVAAVDALLSRMRAEDGRICVTAPDGAPPRSPFVARYAGDIRVVVLAPEDPLALYCAACDVMLLSPSGVFSAAAAVCGKPLVHLPASDPFEAQTADFFSARGMSLAGQSAEESAALAIALAKDNTAKAAMCNAQKQACIPDAAQRVVRFLHEGRL
jgi:processive 1,2-diacylglycerol beta-glucosyltransferase